jgi:hypothetical protein
MTSRKLVFHADPSHGWLQVSVLDLLILGICPSHYSYINDNSVYLEEDCDATLYLDAARVKGWVINITEKYTNSDSVIRTYERFEAAHAHQ